MSIVVHRHIPKPAVGLTIDPQIVNLAPNTALDLGYLFDTMTIPNGEFIAETASFTGNGGFAYDAKRAQLVTFSGGHAGSNYNAVLIHRLTNPLTVLEDYKPTPAQPDMVCSNYETCPVGGVAQDGRGCFLTDISSVGGPYPRPASRHTSGQIIVWNDELILFGVIEGNGRFTQQAVNDGSAISEYVFNCKGQVAHYKLDGTRTWEFEAPPFAGGYSTQTDGQGGSQQWGQVAYDPLTGLIIWMTYVGLYTYDPTTRTLTRLITWNSPDGLARIVDENDVQTANTLDITSSLAYNSQDQNFYWFSSNLYLSVQGRLKWPTNESFQPWRLELDRANIVQGAPGATQLTKLVTTGDRPDYTVKTTLVGHDYWYAGSGEQAVRFDSHNNVFGTGPWNSKFYTFNANTKVWSSRVVNGFTGNMAFLSHMLEYAPDPVNAWLWFTDWNHPTSRSRAFAYRLA